MQNPSNSAISGWTTTRLVDDRDSWESIVGALAGHTLQSWDWGLFKSRHNWRPIRFVVAHDGDPVLAAQVLIQRVGPFSVAYAPRGPVGWENAPDEAISTLSVYLDELQRRQRGVISFLEPDIQRDDSAPCSVDSWWTMSCLEFQPRRTIKVAVDKSDDELLGAMKSKTRYNVRLARRRGVTIRQGGGSDLGAFYRMLEETSARDEFGIHTQEYYRDLLSVFGDRAALLIAEYEGRPAASIITLAHRREAIYLFGASSSEFQRHMPTHLLQFEAMRLARDRGCDWYDMWGIPATDRAPETVDDSGGSLNVRSGLWGVYRFKQGFGGEVVTYPGVYERVHRPHLVSLWRRLSRKHM